MRPQSLAPQTVPPPPRAGNAEFPSAGDNRYLSGAVPTAWSGHQAYNPLSHHIAGLIQEERGCTPEKSQGSASTYHRDGRTPSGEDRLRGAWTVSPGRRLHRTPPLSVRAAARPRWHARVIGQAPGLGVHVLYPPHGVDRGRKARRESLKSRPSPCRPAPSPPSVELQPQDRLPPGADIAVAAAAPPPRLSATPQPQSCHVLAAWPWLSTLPGPVSWPPKCSVPPPRAGDRPGMPRWQGRPSTHWPSWPLRERVKTGSRVTNTCARNCSGHECAA